jgi:hypothetical protein
MEVRRCGASCHADAGDDVALLNLLSNVNVESIQMAIPRGQSIPVVEDNQIAVVGFAIGVYNLAIRRRFYGRAVLTDDVQPEVYFCVSCIWIRTAAEVANYESLKGPDGRRLADGDRAFLGHFFEQFKVTLEIVGTI